MKVIRDGFGRVQPIASLRSRNRPIERRRTTLPDVLGYARVSTSDQRPGPGGAEPPFARRGGRNPSVRRCGVRQAVRPSGLTALLDFARSGDINCVVRLDRLGRSLKELLETVDGFKGRGLAFRSLEERLDTASAAGELVFHVFGAIAHFERRLIVERTRDGLAAARARGKVPGGPPLDQDTLGSAFRPAEGVRSASRNGVGVTDRCGCEMAHHRR